MLLEGGDVPPASPIARAPDDGARVVPCPAGSELVGPAAAGAVEAVDAAGAAVPKTTTPKEEGRGASVGPAGIGLVEEGAGEEAATGAVVPGTMKPPGGIVMEGVTGAVEAAAGGVGEGEVAGVVDAGGAGAAVPGKRGSKFGRSLMSFDWWRGRSRTGE